MPVLNLSFFKERFLQFACLTSPFRGHGWLVIVPVATHVAQVFLDAVQTAGAALRLRTAPVPCYDAVFQDVCLERRNEKKNWHTLKGNNRI